MVFGFVAQPLNGAHTDCCVKHIVAEGRTVPHVRDEDVGAFCASFLSRHLQHGRADVCPHPDVARSREWDTTQSSAAANVQNVGGDVEGQLQEFQGTFSQ